MTTAAGQDPAATPADRERLGIGVRAGLPLPVIIAAAGIFGLGWVVSTYAERLAASRGRAER